MLTSAGSSNKPWTGHRSICIATVNPFSLHFHQFSQFYSRIQHFAGSSSASLVSILPLWSLLLFTSPPQKNKNQKKKICIYIPLLWRCRIFHSWEYILNLTSRSISDKHIMFYFKHKMQFWSFHNDTVNRDTARKRPKKPPKTEDLFFKAEMLLVLQDCDVLMRSQLHMLFVSFFLLISVFNYQALKVGQEEEDHGIQSQLEPWSRIKLWAFAGSGATVSVCQHRSHPRIHAATKRAGFVTIIRVLLALAQLNARAHWTSLKGL